MFREAWHSLSRPTSVWPAVRREVTLDFTDKVLLTLYMHSCHHHLPHRRTTVLDSVKTHFSYLNAQHVSLTVISWCACCIKTPTRPIVSSLFYFTTFFLSYVLGIGTVLVHSRSTVFLMFRCAFCHALFAIKEWWWWWWWCNEPLYLSRLLTPACTLRSQDKQVPTVHAVSIVIGRRGFNYATPSICWISIRKLLA